MLKQFFISNIDSLATENDVAKVLGDHGLTVETSNIHLREGCAVVDAEIESMEEVIQKLAGVKLNEREICVKESQLQKSSPRNSPSTTKLLLKNTPEGVSEEDVCKLVKNHGETINIEKRNNHYILTYSCIESAQRAKEELSEINMHGNQLAVEFCVKKVGPRLSNVATSDCPLRLLVPHTLVGAIIGRGGATIQMITQQTNARIDVLRHNSPLPNEKVICISGGEDGSCMNALREILQVVHQATPSEGSEPSKSQLDLKMLVPNNLCGRLIGKKGLIIRSIMSETATSITVNATTSMAIIGPERVAVILGPQIDNLVSAAGKIYAKVKSCSEENLLNSQYVPQNHITYPSVSIMSMYPMPTYSPIRPYPQPYIAPNPNPVSLPQVNNIGGHLTVLFYIPKISVGAVIGSKGSFINFVKQDSHASCQIQHLSDEIEPDERPVKITGYQEGVWRACFHIYTKLKQEGFLTSEADFVRTELMVLKSSVGRIIGKGGQNVRYIQDSTQCTINFPERQNQDEEVPVEIIGTFHLSIMAQSMVRQLLLHGQIPIAQAPILSPPPMYQNTPLRPPMPHHVPAYLPPGLITRHDRGDYSHM